jgi:hypothetical protein
MSGELTCARSTSANASAQRAGGWSRCHRTRVTPTSLAPSSWPAVPADPSVSRSRRKRRPDQGDPQSSEAMQWQAMHVPVMNWTTTDTLGQGITFAHGGPSEVPVVGDQMAAWVVADGQGHALHQPADLNHPPAGHGIRRLPQAVAPRVQAVHAGGAGAGQRVEYAVVPLDPRVTIRKAPDTHRSSPTWTAS